MNSHINDDVLQMAVFKLDDDLRVKGSSISASHLFSSFSDGVLNMRLGDALQCINSFGTEKGCGFGATCPRCVLRNTISECFTYGNVVRERLEMNLRRGNSSSWHKLIITANLLKDSSRSFVALIVEELHSTLLNGKLTLNIDEIKSYSDAQYQEIIEDHILKYRTVTFQSAPN